MMSHNGEYECCSVTLNLPEIPIKARGNVGFIHLFPNISFLPFFLYLRTVFEHRHIYVMDEKITISPMGIEYRLISVVIRNWRVKSFYVVKRVSSKFSLFFFKFRTFSWQPSFRQESAWKSHLISTKFAMPFRANTVIGQANEHMLVCPFPRKYNSITRQKEMN